MVKPPPASPEHHCGDSAGAVGSLGKVFPVSPMNKTHSIPKRMGNGIHLACESYTSKISKGLAVGMVSAGSWCFGSAPLHCELCLFNQGVQHCQATLFQRSRCIVHCWAIPGACPSASILHFSGPALHRVGANFTPEPGVPCCSQFSLRALGLDLLVQGARHRGAVPGLGEVGSGLSPLGVCAAVMLWAQRSLRCYHGDCVRCC